MSILKALIETHLGLQMVLEASYVDQHGWTHNETTSFRRGFKKYKRDKRAMSAYEDLMDFVRSQKDQPQISEYPPELYVHPLAVDKRFGSGAMSAHLKGQKIVLVFKVDYKSKTIEKLGIGTHQDFGWR